MGRALRHGAIVLLMLVVAGVAAPGGPIAGAASPTTAAVTVTLASRATPWSDTVTVPRFDGSLGELQAVHVEVGARVDATIALENLTPAAAADVPARAAAALAVLRPSGPAIATATPTVNRTQDLGAFDGTNDRGGTSGDRAEVNASATVTVALTAPTDLALFTGSAPISLPATGTDQSVPPAVAGIDADIDTRIGGTVSVSYTYVTDERPPDPPTILTSPPAFTADADPVVTFSHEDGAVAECRLTGPAGAAAPWAVCTSPWQGHLAAVGDGAYTFAVRATDAAGNVGTATARSFTLDRVAPVAPTVTFTPLPLTWRWTFSVEPGATARCSFDGAAATPCTSPVSVDLATLLDGPHALAVHAVDAAGNVGPVATSEPVLDRLPPAPPTITSWPASPAGDPTPTWSFTLAADATSATCAVDGAAPVACSSPFTADLAAAGDGPHTISVRNADAAGNQSPATTASYVLDRVAPAAPTVTAPPSPSNDTTPTWLVGAGAGEILACRLDSGPFAPCAGSHTATLGPGSDGVHVLTVRATDAAGNAGPEVTSSYTLDTRAPSAPVLLTGPADPSNDPLPTWTFSIEPWSSAACSVDGGAWVACSSPHQADLSAAPDGPHTLAVRATDPVGNVGPSAQSTFVLDRTAPTAAVITASPASPGREPTVSFSFTTPPGSRTRCRVDTRPAFDCTGSATVTLTKDGRHTFYVFSIDAAGNRSSPAEASYFLDRLAPAAPTLTEEPVSPTRLTAARWAFAIEPGSTGECRLDGGDWTPCSSAYNADLVGAPDGVHTFEVRATDAAGNVGHPTTDSVWLDRTPPGAPTITSGPEGSTRDDTPVWTFTVEGGAAAQCRLDDGPWVACAGSLAADLTGAPDGTHSLEVRALDAVGNEGPASIGTYELDRAAPAPAAFTGAPASPGHDPAPTWSFLHEPGATAWCSLDGEPPVPCDGAVTAPELPDGDHVLTVTIVDDAGNSSEPASSTYALDTAAPAAPVLTAPRSPGRDARPEWLIEVEPGASAECSLDGAQPLACASVFTADLAGRDGPHQLLVTARDPAGNLSPPVLSAYVLDTVAPRAPAIVHTPDASAWVWRFTIEPAASAECSRDGAPWAPCTSPVAGGAPDRPVRFEVRAVDRAGNRSPVTRVATTPTRTAAVPPVPPVPPAPPRPAPVGQSGGPAPDVGGTPLPRAPSVTPPGAPASVARPATGELLPEARLRDRATDRAPRPTMGERGLFAGPVRDLLQAAAHSTTIPVLVVLVVLAFVAVQNRIDRLDPKLADAPIRHEPEYLEFE